MNLGVNQTRQFYAISTASATLTAKGQGGFAVNGNDIYFVHYGEGGKTRSDIINKGNILYANASAPTEKKGQVFTITMPTPISGQDYILNITHNNFVSMSDENTYVKHGAVHATAGMTDAQLATAMATSINNNYKRDLNKIVEASASGATLTLTVLNVEAERYIMGVYHHSIPTITVSANQVYDASSDTMVDWLNATESLASFTPAVYNDYEIMDMEYFCMGDRADMIREVGWPNTIHTKYMTPGMAGNGFYVLDVHYAYVGANESVQKSEKTLTIVCPTKAQMNTLIGQFNTASGLSISTL